MSNLADKLKYYRKCSNLTQQQVADALGILRSTYAYYESGKTHPKLSTLQNIARLFNTDIDNLVEDVPIDNNYVELNSPDLFKGKLAGETVNQLTDFEQSVLLRIRMMSINEKKSLAEFLDNIK